jgi:hypothetical protein
MRQLVAYLCFELFLTSTSKYTEVCRGSIHTFALTKHYLIFSNDPCVKYSTSRNREVEFRWPVESLNKVFLLYPHLIFKVSRYSTYRTFDVYFFLILTDKKFIRCHRHWNRSNCLKRKILMMRYSKYFPSPLFHRIISPANVIRIYIYFFPCLHFLNQKCFLVSLVLYFRRHFHRYSILIRQVRVKIVHHGIILNKFLW